MTNDELQAIQDRVTHATRGPWLSDDQINDWVEDKRRSGLYVRFYQPNERLNHIAFVDAREVYSPNGSIRPLHDAAFIAHARSDVPALIAEVRRLQARLRALEWLMGGMGLFLVWLLWVR